MFKHALNNSVTAVISYFLKEQYDDKKSSVDSLITQLLVVGQITRYGDCLSNIKGMIKKIDNLSTYIQNMGISLGIGRFRGL